MAAMEKISFPPLIAEFSDHSALYNQWNNDHEMTYGELPAQAISSWMVTVVEPIVTSVFTLNSAPEKVHEVVKALYQESLQLLGSGLAIRYKNDYQMAWLLMAKNPNLLIMSPIKTLSLVNDVVLNLNTYAPEKNSFWCELMAEAITEISTLEDFKIVGRIYAWMCGLAHLRKRLKADFDKLSENAQQATRHTIGLERNVYDFFEKPWVINTKTFQGVLGGFEGATGFFAKPPVLAQIDDYVFATDTTSSYALFSDHYGNVLMPANTVDATHILSQSKRVDSLEKWLKENPEKMNSQDISSVVATKDTLFYTLHHSFFIYCYSLKNA